ncbi:MAG: hypothetical protein HQM16_06905 [Deltaproteobacteria bacterium]|nr:hypothetical protein [Deltaproteobacteria bacterium]
MTASRHTRLLTSPAMPVIRNPGGEWPKIKSQIIPPMMGRQALDTTPQRPSLLGGAQKMIRATASRFAGNLTQGLPNMSLTGSTALMMSGLQFARATPLMR